MVMECPKGHVWVETFPEDHPLYGVCPRCVDDKAQED